MLEQLGNLLEGLGAVMDPLVLTMLVIGVLAGLLLALIPGLSGVTGMAILLPIALTFEPNVALALLLGMYTASTISDVLPSILLGIPGTAGAQAHVVEGYPLTKQGQGARAIAAAYSSDVMAMVMAFVVIIGIFPFLTTVALAFGSPELLMLVLVGLSMVGMVSGGAKNAIRGLLMGVFGVLLSTIGLAPQTGTARYTFDFLYLWEGLHIVPVVLGLFGLSEMIVLYGQNRTVAAEGIETRGSLREGLMDTVRNRFLVFRAAMIGGLVGFLPGIGGAIADWMGYGHAVQSAKDKSLFTKGDIRGVIGAESAVAGAKPFSILPTMIFGVPGSVPLAILLGGLLVIGIRPTPTIVAEEPSFVLSLLWMVIIANVIGVLIAIGVGRVVVRITLVPIEVLAPFIVASLVMASVAATGSLGDIIVLCVFGVVGVAMQFGNWPRPPLILGLVLGGLAERYMFISLDRYGMSWVAHPIVIGLALFAVAPVFIMLGQRAVGKYRVNTSNSIGDET